MWFRLSNFLTDVDTRGRVLVFTEDNWISKSIEKFDLEFVTDSVMTWDLQIERGLDPYQYRTTDHLPST